MTDREVQEQPNDTADDMRFSDQELVRLREEFEEHKEVQAQRWEQLAQMVSENSQTTREMSKDLRAIAENTAGVVELYRDFQGAAKVGVGLRRFIAWLIALGSGGAIIAAGIVYVLERAGIKL